jgi:hypothetical protein
MRPGRDQGVQMKPLLSTAIALFLLSAAPLAAQAAGSQVKVIRVMGDDIRVPVPEGYCEPQGSYRDNAQRAEASDSQNVTFLTFFRCDEMAAGGDLQHLIYIKAPKPALSARATLKELLDGMGSIPASDLASALDDDKIRPGVEKDASQVFGTNVQIKSEIKPAAKDAFGWYMAGTVDYSVAGKNLGLAVAIGMTAVKGHVLSYNTYGPGKDVAAVRATLAQAKAETKVFVEAN